jgi:hypothetical protein
MSALVSVHHHPAGFLEGRAQPGCGRHGEIMASFLQSDIQGDLETAQRLLAEIAAAEHGEPPQPGGAGNAFAIAIRSPSNTASRSCVPHSRPGSPRSKGFGSRDEDTSSLSAGRVLFDDPEKFLPSSKAG